MEGKISGRFAYVTAVIVLLIGLALSLLLAVAFGSTHIPFQDVYRTISRRCPERAVPAGCTTW